MEYEIKHRYTNAAIYTADIDAPESTPESVKLGLAVMAALKAEADLRSADLRHAHLRSANLRSADLRSADLRYANLRYANLRSADLSYANLRYADLSYADLSGADLSSANLSSADLNYADLRSANLRSAVGDNPYVRTLFTGTYAVTYTDAIMHIGCQCHAIADWWGFDDAAIAAMDGKKALEFWRTWKPILQSIIAAAPAQPTGYVEPVAEPTP